MTSIRRSEYEFFYTNMRYRFMKGTATPRDYKHAANLNTEMRKHWELKTMYYLELHG